MNLDQFIFSQLQDLERFEAYWRTLPEADVELQHGDWLDQFNLWLEACDR